MKSSNQEGNSAQVAYKWDVYQKERESYTNTNR